MLVKYVFTQLYGHGQDVTKGQFFTASFNLEFFFPEIFYLTHSSVESEKKWVHAFPKGISTKGNTDNFILDLKSAQHFHLAMTRNVISSLVEI